ncbi:MAG: hypothetical protein WBH73_03535 [Arcanobacterium sp.]
MKTPDKTVLASLSKAEVTDPIIAGNATVARNASVAGNTGNGVIKKFTIRIPEQLLARIRAAYLYEMAIGNNAGSLSAWAANQLEEAVNAIERNSGITLEPVNTGTLPTGPMA